MATTLVRLASTYGRYGYRRIMALLRADGWQVNTKRVARIWLCKGLMVPRRQPKRGWLWLNYGSCIRLRPCWPGHVWPNDFCRTASQMVEVPHAYGDRRSAGRPSRTALNNSIVLHNCNGRRTNIQQNHLSPFQYPIEPNNA